MLQSIEFKKITKKKYTLQSNNNTKVFLIKAVLFCSTDDIRDFLLIFLQPLELFSENIP